MDATNKETSIKKTVSINTKAKTKMVETVMISTDEDSEEGGNDGTVNDDLSKALFGSQGV